MRHLLIVVFLLVPFIAQGAEPPDALSLKIIKEVEDNMRGKAAVGEMEMYIHKYKRTLKMKFWEIVPSKSLVRVTGPAEDAGMGTLKLGDELWTYNPGTDMLQQVPPSLMLDSWMGSDFSNDDISRSSSIVEDYDIGGRVAAEFKGVKTWRITLKPKPNSPVVWEKMVVEVAQDDHRGLRQEYYDEKGRVARIMLFEDYRKLDDRNYPYKWRMINKQDPSRYTEIRVLKMEFKDKLSKRIFSFRSLKKGRR